MENNHYDDSGSTGDFEEEYEEGSDDELYVFDERFDIKVFSRIDDFLWKIESAEDKSNKEETSKKCLDAKKISEDNLLENIPDTQSTDDEGIDKEPMDMIVKMAEDVSPSIGGSVEERETASDKDADILTDTNIEEEIDGQKEPRRSKRLAEKHEDKSGQKFRKISL